MNLENMTKIYARGDSRIQLKVIPGHFVTSQSHITHYLDLTTMKSRTAEAQNIAHYRNNYANHLSANPHTQIKKPQCYVFSSATQIRILLN